MNNANSRNQDQTFQKKFEGYSPSLTSKILQSNRPSIGGKYGSNLPDLNNTGAVPPGSASIYSKNKFNSSFVNEN